MRGSQGPGALGLSQPTETDQRPDSRDWPEARGAVQARFYWGCAAAEGREKPGFPCLLAHWGAGGRRVPYAGESGGCPGVGLQRRFAHPSGAVVSRARAGHPALALNPLLLSLAFPR